MISKKIVAISSGALIALSFVVIHAYSSKATSKATRRYDIDGSLDHDNVVPMVIIGSGPGGLSAAIYGARANIKTLVISGDKPGGQLTDTSWVENWPGSDKPILGPDITENLRKQAANFGAQFLDDVVEHVDFSQWPFKIFTEQEKQINALTVIIATGSRPRMLKVPGSDEYWGRGITSCATCDAPFYKDEEVVVVGGGDSAVEEAIQLAQFAKKITILVRKEKMRAAPAMQERLSDYPSISVYYNVEIQKILGDDMQVTHVELKNNRNGQLITFPTSGVFLAIGHDPNTTIFKKHLKLTPSRHIELSGRSQETSIHGVFAAGDVEDQKYRQAGVASGRGIVAALDAIDFLNEIGFNANIAKRLKTFDPEQEEVEDHVRQLKTIDVFEQEVEQNSKGLVFIDFFADYCSSCMQMIPVYTSVAQEYADKATFFKVDVQEAVDLAKKMYVYKVPCLLVYDDGKLKARYHNAMNKKELEAFVQRFLDED